MTPLTAYNRLDEALRCLEKWDDFIRDVRDGGGVMLIDVTVIARRVCSLDAATRESMHQIECLMLGKT